MNSPIRTDDNGLLLCPACHGHHTHVDIVRIAAREEDREFNEITVNAVTEQVITHDATAAPVGQAQGFGRRHRIAVTGYCEEGGHSFAIVFTQHKGNTYVETVTPIPHDVGDPR